MKNIKFILLLAILMVLPSVLSLTVPINETFNIVHPVRIDDYPNSDIDCNISVYSPNNTELVDFQPMSNNFENHNYSLNPALLNVSGTYTYDMTCTTGLSNQTDSFEFLVNPTGIEPSDSRTASITRGIYVLFGASIIFFIAFMFMPVKLPLKMTFFIFAFLFFLTALNLISVSLVDEVVNPRLEAFFDGYTAIYFVLFWFASGLLIFIWMFTFLNTIIMKQNERNLQRFG